MAYTSQHIFFCRKMDELTSIGGIGKELARKLLPHLNLARPIRPQLLTPKIWALLPSAAQAYLRYKPQTSVPRKYFEKLEREGLIIAGSYRRGLATVNDLDILARSFKDVEKYFEPPFAAGEEIVRTHYQYARGKYIAVDVFITRSVIPPAAYLLFATGSKKFNIIIRGRAKAKGLLLNQWGLWRGEKKIPTPTERDIFAEIGLTYLQPSER